MELLQEFYETTLEALKDAKNDRLWFKTNCKVPSYSSFYYLHFMCFSNFPVLTHLFVKNPFRKNFAFQSLLTSCFTLQKFRISLL